MEAGFDRYEGLLRTREDARVPVEVTLWLVDAGSGRLVAFLRDLSERKRHEDRLRFSEDLFRSAFSYSPVAMCLTLPDGRFGKVNKALCELLGYPEEELLARGFRDVTVKEDITASNKLVRDAMAGKMQGFTLRKRYKHRAGKTIWANVSTFLRRDESGKPVYFITHIEDVTARVLAETERDQTMRDLVRSNTDLDRFARAASLQLEEPLHGLVACVRLLAERYGGKLDGEADNLLGTATDAAVRLQRFLRDLLVYSQAQSRGGQFRKVNPNRELAAAIQELRGAIEASKASVTADVLPAVQGDGPQIARLFQNLLDNAITFRGQESPRIRVSARIVAGFAEVSIADNGIGIPFEHRERVFGLFQRQDPTRKTAGSGIGLAMCKSIVERHGGRIWVESGPAAGSIFRFTLPLAEK